MKFRPFAYNPTHNSISGTEQLGDLAIGVTSQDYSSRPGNVDWWSGPDEDLGYIICIPVSTGNQPTPFGNIGTVGFYRSNELTESSFVYAVNNIFGLSYTLGLDCKNWLNSNGYWTSFTQNNSSADSETISSDTFVYSADQE